MYNHIYEEMEDAKVATPYAAPMWQDCDGNPCLEKDAFRCKVNHNLTHPEMCAVMDEPPDTQSRYAVETYEWEARGPMLVEEEVAMVVAEAAVALRREDLTIEQQSDIQFDIESV